MATRTGTKQQTGAKKASAENVDVKVAAKQEVQVETIPPVHTDSNKQAKKMEPVKKLSLTDLVCVQSCFYGGLIYVSKKSGDIVEWNEFGSEQYMSVEELLYMRNTQPDFFRRTWVRLIGDNAEEAFAFLHLERYCKDSLMFKNFEDVFKLPVEQIKSTIDEFSDSMKESFARFALECIQDGTLNNLSTIKTIERATGFDLLN